MATDVTVARPETWQLLGYESFGEWRRASEKARRASKRAAASRESCLVWQPPVALPAPATPVPRMRPLAYLSWKEYKQLDENSRAESISQWGGKRRLRGHKLLP